MGTRGKFVWHLGAAHALNPLFQEIFRLARRGDPAASACILLGWLAMNGKADMIVSGDADLLVLNPFRGIPVVSPAVFVQGAARQ